MRRTRALVGAAVGIAAAIGVLASIPVLFGSPVLLVEITWRGVDEAGRRELEQRFRLSEATRIAVNRWQYVPESPSSEELRAILQHPSVAATDGIDERALRISPNAPQSARRGGLITAPLLARGAKLLALLLLFVAGVLLIVAATPGDVFERWRDRQIERVTHARADPRDALARAFATLREQLERGVPTATAESAAAFRIAFGMLLLALLTSHPARETALESAALNDASSLVRAVVGPFATPDGLALLDRLAVVSTILVIVGLLTPITTTALALVVCAWACVFTLNTTHHTVATLVATMICLAGAPAGHAWSIDAWLWRRKRRALASPSKRYGFVFWLPGLVFGVAFLAAAWAKVGDGPAWILNGTVKYHFASDSSHALVPWGLTLTRYPPVAIAMSAAAVAVELCLIVASFTRSIPLRVALGMAGALLLAGFVLFQGVFWPGWWILLLSFLPWQLIGAARSPAEPSTLSRWQLGVIVAVLTAHAIAALRPLEIRPILSAYDMYSTTYGSPEEYRAASNLVYRVVVVRNGTPTDVPGCELDDRMVERITSAPSQATQLRAELARAGDGCAAVRGGRDAVTLIGDRPFYDFDAGRHVRQRAVDAVGPIVDW